MSSNATENTKAGPPGPEFFLQMHFGAAPPRLLSAGIQLGVFSFLGKRPATAEEVASGVKASPRGMRMLLDALTGLQLVRKSDSRYELAPISAQYLVASSPDYAGAMMENEHFNRMWDSVVDAIRTGRPAHRVEAEAEAGAFFPSLVRSLHVLNREPARRAASHLCLGLTSESPRVLDVACGSGVWGIACAELNPRARVTAHDYPAILELTQGFARQHRVSARFEFLAGDLKKVDFGEAKFDVAILGNIVHSEGERSSRDLLRRLARAVKSGGRVGIVDMIPNDERTGPPFALIFAVNMLMNTEFGDTYTLGEYTRWLKEAGFSKVETPDIASHSPLIVATRD